MHLSHVCESSLVQVVLLPISSILTHMTLVLPMSQFCRSPPYLLPLPTYLSMSSIAVLTSPDAPDALLVLTPFQAASANVFKKCDFFLLIPLSHFYCKHMQFSPSRSPEQNRCFIPRIDLSTPARHSKCGFATSPAALIVWVSGIYECSWLLFYTVYVCF